MKRNLILLGIVIILGVLAFFIVKNNKGKDTYIDYDMSYREFAVKDIDDIHKIVLINRSEYKGTNTLERQGDHWTINQKHKANPIMVSNLLDVIKRIKIDYVPPNVAIENIMKEMIYNSVKVELYDKDGKAIKKYYVGGSPAKSKGTFFLMEGAASPLVMNLPNFVGNLRVRFAYSETTWRDRTIFAENPKNIEQVKLNYNYATNSSFLIRKENDNYYISRLNHKNNKKKVKTKKVESYLLAFEKKGAEGIEDNEEVIKSTLEREPIASIDIKRIDGSSSFLKFYMIPWNDEKVKKDKKGIDKYLNQSILRYYAQDENGDVFLVQYEVFKDIFIGYDYFL